MYIYNFKLNKTKLSKGFLVLFILICLIILFFSLSKFFHNMKSYKENILVVNDTYQNTITSQIPSNQYTNVLKTVHENLDSYIGKEICFTGYIYKIDYLKGNQFVLARNMIINEASQTVIVGFLCEYDKITEFKDLSWIEIIGTIQKGDLNGEIPIIEVTNIKQVEKPIDEFVYPPDDTYIPTSNIY